MAKDALNSTKGLACPICGTVIDRVKDVNHYGNYSLRRRECENKHRYNTIETYMANVNTNILSKSLQKKQNKILSSFITTPSDKLNTTKIKKNVTSKLSEELNIYNNIKSKYKDYYKDLLKEEDDFGKEGEDWVRPGSDLDPGMDIGKTNFPHGQGYPNYRPKKDDMDDFNDVAFLDKIYDVDYENVDEDNRKRKDALYGYIKKKLPNFYSKFKEFIDDSYQKYEGDLFLYELNSWIIFSNTDPTHHNVPNTLKNKNTNNEDLETLHKLYDIDAKLYSLLHHKDDVNNTLNYPLFVSLYDVTRELGGYEEGGWWYDGYELIESIEVKSPDEVLPAAEQLYEKIHRLDGKPEILIEKKKGSQEKDSPTYS